MKDINRIPTYDRALQTALAGMLRNVGDEALEAIENGFQQGTSPAGEPWAPLAQSTIEQKGHDTILVDEGDLRESFDTNVQWSPVGEKTLTIYTEDEKMKYHEFGTERMPRRPILEPTARVVQNDILPGELTDAAEAAENAAGIL